MRKLFIALLLLFLGNMIFAYEGDSLGSHKANKDLDMREHDIVNPKLVDGVDIPELAISTGTVNRPYTLVVGFTKDCDFICDGTDDHVQIQQAHDAMTSSGTITCREGDYDLTANTAISSEGISIVGQGTGTKFHITTGVDAFTVTGANCRIRNLSIDGAASYKNFVLVTGDGFQLTDCNIEYGSYTYAIKLSGVKKCLITGNNFETESIAAHLNHAVWVSLCEEIIVEKNTFETTSTHDVVKFDIVLNSILAKNIVKTGRFHLIKTSETKVTDNIMDGENTSARGMRFTTETSDVSISENTLLNYTSAAIKIEDITSDIVVSGNRIKCEEGIYLKEDDNINKTMIHGNNFRGCISEINDNGTNTKIRNNIDKDGEWFPETDNLDMDGNDIEDVYNLDVQETITTKYLETTGSTVTFFSGGLGYMQFNQEGYVIDMSNLALGDKTTNYFFYFNANNKWYSSGILKVPTAMAAKFEDLNNTLFYIDPANASNNAYVFKSGGRIGSGADISTRTLKYDDYRGIPGFIIYVSTTYTDVTNTHEIVSHSSGVFNSPWSFNQPVDFNHNVNFNGENNSFCDVSACGEVTFSTVNVIGEHHDFAEISVTTGTTATVLTDQNVWYQITTLTSTVGVRGLTSGGNEIIISTEGWYHVSYPPSFSGTIKDKTIEFGIFKNNGAYGTGKGNLEHLRAVQLTNGVGTFQTVPIIGKAYFYVGDHVEAWVRCTCSDTNSVTVRHGVLDVDKR